MLSNSSEPNEPPKTNIPNSTLPNINRTISQGQHQIKPSQNQMSIPIPTNQNIQQNTTLNQSNPGIFPPKTSKQPGQNNINPDKTLMPQPKKSTTGGKLVQDSKVQQKPPQNLDITLNFSLHYLADSMATGKRPDRKDLQKIIRNFGMYIKEKKQKFSLESIQQSFNLPPHLGTQEIKIIKLAYLNGLQDKQKMLLGLFWQKIMDAVCKRLPFLSIQGCYEIIKLQIGLNKHLYCEKDNGGTFDVKLFMDNHLFPVINNKILVDENHKIFKDLQRQIQNLTMGLFRGMRGIFRELCVMKKEQLDKYTKVFGELQNSNEMKVKVIHNLLASFQNMIVKVDEQLFQNYISYFECVIESLWFYYQTEKNHFNYELSVNFIKFLDENYLFFNSYGVTTSKSAKNFVNNVEKLALGFLFRSPLNFEKWPRQMKDLIFKSNLEIFEPFRYLLEYNVRQEFEDNKRQYRLRGIHWKEFIDSIIKLRTGELESVDSDSIDFIIRTLENFLAQNADIFWRQPSEFESFTIFTNRYNDVFGKKFSSEQLRQVLLNMMRIATSLMGKSLEQLKQKQTEFVDGDVQYPETKRLSYAKNVHIEFAQRFMKISNQQFLACVCDELRTIIIESTETQTTQQQLQLDDVRILKPQDIVKTYFLKLLISEPYLLFQFRKNLKDIKETDLVNFLIIKTIKNPLSNTELIDLAFAALDTLLITEETAKLIQNILSLGQVPTAKSLPALAQRMFDNQHTLTFVSRHCNILINNNYQSREWTRELLKNFCKKCQENIGDSVFRNYQFVISYSQLLSNIVGIMNFGTNLQLLQLKPFINIPFIINSIKYYLRFDYHKDRYINMVIQQQKKDKIQALVHSIRVYNTVLLYCLKNKNSKKTQTDLYTGSLFKSKKILPVNNQLISAYQARQLGIEDKEFYLQVRAGNQKNETTSYANALSLILISAKDQQRKILKEINTDYQTLIFETIENLVKLNSKQDLTQLFSISQGTASIPVPMKSLGIRGSQKSLIKHFIAYVEQSLNSVGIEIIIFGKFLIQEPERLRRLIDRLRSKLQNPTIRMRIKPELQLKLISTLSRYFRESMVQMSLHKRQAFNELQIQEHFEYLIQCIVEFIGPFKSTDKPHEAKVVDDILSNLYGGFLTVQTFSMRQFFKWLKNYHVLLLNDVNLKYMRNINNQVIPEELQSIYTLGEEYFNLLNLFLNCDQYLETRDFKVIAQIKNLPDTLSDFIRNIAIYSTLSILAQPLCEIMLQTLTMSLRFYSLILINQEQRKALFHDVLRSIKAQQLKPTTNLILLEIQLFNEFQAKYSSDEIDFSNFNLWPLQMNCIDHSFSTPSVRKIIDSLKKSTLNSTSFVSICNGLHFLIENSQTLEQSKSVLAKDLFAVYKYFVNQVGSSQPRQTWNSIMISLSNPKSNPSNAQQCSSSYKKVWILELLLAILSSSEFNQAIDNVRAAFQNTFLGDETVLKRFGILMRKLCYSEAQTYISWLSHLDRSIQQAITEGQTITFAEKLELNQLFKMFNFVVANQAWTSHFADGLTQLVETFVSYRKIFENLSSSGKKPRPRSQQQQILERISLKTFAETDQMMRSAINQLEKQRLQDNVLKSTNSFELMHQILNIELSTQYSLICLTIAQTQHLAMFKKNPLLSDGSKWNIVLMDFVQTLSVRYLEMIRNEKILKVILNTFRESYYLANDNNLQLSNEMLFTNSESVSCCLNGSFELLTQVMMETLELLLERILGTLKKMQKELHLDYKAKQEEFAKIVSSLKKHDKQGFNWGMYEGSEKKVMIAHTIRSNMTRTMTSKTPIR